MTLKKLVEFICSKFGTFFARNTSVEDQYTRAANLLIDKIHQLRVRFESSKAEKIKLTALAEDKRTRQKSKEKEIIHLRKTQPETDVTTHVKLALLYRNMAAGLDKKAAEIDEIQENIKTAVVQLDDQRADLAVKLEYIREARNADSLGLDSVADVVKTANLTSVDVETILRRVDTFSTAEVPAEIQSTSADVAEYLAEIEARG